MTHEPIVLGVVAIVLLVGSIFTVQSRTVAIAQRLGKIRREAGRGGYGILKALVTDIEPDTRVKESNEINAAQRIRVAGTEKGEAERIDRVKYAEGDAQSKALASRGIADQRAAIIVGLRDSVDEFPAAPSRQRSIG